MENIITDEILDILADKIVCRVNTVNKELYYGEIARLKSCSIHFNSDNQHRDEFLIKNNDDKVVGQFKEVTKCKDCMHHYCTERNLWCDIFEKIMPEDGYCCFGESDYGM